MTLAAKEQELIDAARTVRDNAHAPYSRFHVGAALRCADGSIHVGVNVENSSYGQTICAERHAVGAAVAAGAKAGDVVEVAVVAEAAMPTPPCGACRQVLSEISRPNTTVVCFNLRDQKLARFILSDLLPNAFGAANIPDPT
jgi:cytidine deaminase